MRLDRGVWYSTDHIPVRMLGEMGQQRLRDLAQDGGFLSFYDRTLEHFRAYLGDPNWWAKADAGSRVVAYFSAEYGLAECLPIYSGGLGVLSGHHLKSASDLGLPVVGVGLLYQQGYF